MSSRYAVLSDVVLKLYKSKDCKGSGVVGYTIKSFRAWQGRNIGIFGKFVHYGMILALLENDASIILKVDSEMEKVRWMNAFRNTNIQHITMYSMDNGYEDVDVYYWRQIRTKVGGTQQTIVLPHPHVWLYLKPSDVLQCIHRNVKSVYLKHVVRYGECGHYFKCVWRMLLDYHDVQIRVPLKIQKHIAKEWLAKIELDVHRTYASAPRHRSSEDHDDRFEKDIVVPREDMLQQILLGLAMQYPKVGYCQGLDTLVAYSLQLFQYNQSTCYTFMCTLFEEYDVHGLYSPGLHTLQHKCHQIDTLVETFEPALFRHLQHQGIYANMYCIQWLQTLFIYAHGIPNRVLHRIWTIFIFEKSWKIIFRIILAILQVSKRFILQHTICEIMQHFHTLPNSIIPYTNLIDIALSIKITRKSLSSLEAYLLQRSNGH